MLVLIDVAITATAFLLFLGLIRLVATVVHWRRP